MITDATMTHNEGWHFSRLGRHLERADKTSRILDVKYFLLLPTIADVPRSMTGKILRHELERLEVSEDQRV